MSELHPNQYIGISLNLNRRLYLVENNNCVYLLVIKRFKKTPIVPFDIQMNNTINY